MHLVVLLPPYQILLACVDSRVVKEVVDDSVRVSIEAAQTLADVIRRRNAGRWNSFLRCSHVQSTVVHAGYMGESNNQKDTATKKSDRSKF